MGSAPRQHEFDASRADVFVPSETFTKTAILIEPVDPSTVTVLMTPFGEQTLRGAFYAVAEGAQAYGAARREFEATHEQVGPNRWVKREPVRAYQATEPCEVATFVSGCREASVIARPGDWIVQQATGEVMVIKPAEFAVRYEKPNEARRPSDEQRS
jgi:hypothetical protein